MSDRSLEEMLRQAPSEITYNPIYGTVAAGSFPDKGYIYKLAETSPVQGEELPERPRFNTLSGASLHVAVAATQHFEVLEAEIRRLKGERDWRDEHDRSARISCTTLEPYTKTLDEMSDAELKEALEYSETCGCVFCFHNGYLFRLRSALSASRADALKAREVVREMAEFHGSAHESGCPEDDTCRCKWKAFNDRVNMACCEPEFAILARMEKASPETTKEGSNE